MIQVISIIVNQDKNCVSLTTIFIILGKFDCNFCAVQNLTKDLNVARKDIRDKDEQIEKLDQTKSQAEEMAVKYVSANNEFSTKCTQLEEGMDVNF